MHHRVAEALQRLADSLPFAGLCLFLHGPPQVSPVDGSWNLYSIRATSGPIVVSTSTDEGKSSAPRQASRSDTDRT